MKKPVEYVVGQFYWYNHNDNFVPLVQITGINGGHIFLDEGPAYDTKLSLQRVKGLGRLKPFDVKNDIDKLDKITRDWVESELAKRL